jgi:hypothetical protein
MRRSQADLGVIAAIAVLAYVAASAGAPTAATAVLGLALLGAPGYLLGQLLLGPGSAGLEHVVVVTGLALAVPILGGLLLFVTGVPLHRAAWLGLLAGVTLASDVVLALRRRRGRTEPASWQLAWRRLPPRHAAAFGAAALAAGCGLGLARISAADQHYPGFTQLWLSPGAGGNRAANLGVSNQQGNTTRYRLVLLRHGSVSATWALTLADGQTWRRTIWYPNRRAIAADLYRLPNLSRPYRHVAIASDRAPGS